MARRGAPPPSPVSVIGTAKAGRLSVAIIGRPNVGKSTLFNRLAGKKLALVDDQPGVTRDRRETECMYGGLSLHLFDTAGLEEQFDDSLEARMRRQTETAVADADVILFVIDARAGLTPLDVHFAQWLRRSDRPVILIANKAEGKAGLSGLYDAFSLGLGEPIALSAEHNEGMGDLVEALLPHARAHGADPDIVDDADEAERSVSKRKARAEAVERQARRREASAATLSDDGRERDDTEDEQPDDDDDDDDDIDWSAIPDFEDPEPPKALQICVIGRPNVGKSTLINKLLGQDRLLTGPEAGITRDSIAIDVSISGSDLPIRLIDTAGLRRKAKITERLEKMSTEDTLRALRYAHVAILLLDATDLMNKQDLTIARHVIDEGRALVIGINKWDAVDAPAEAIAAFKDRLEISLPQVKGVPVITLSALQGRNLDRLMRAALDVYDLWNKRIPTARLNQWLRHATEIHTPPAVHGRRVRIRFATQIKTRPPTFALFVSRPDALPDSYLRYLVNDFRETFDVPAVPVRLVLRKRANPYAPKK